jgi:hypothetical protein
LPQKKKKQRITHQVITTPHLLSSPSHVFRPLVLPRGLGFLPWSLREMGWGNRFMPSEMAAEATARRLPLRMEPAEAKARLLPLKVEAEAAMAKGV